LIKTCYHEYMIPANIRQYFWEVDTKKLNPKKHPEYVIARILEYGRPDAIKWAVKNFDKKLIKKVISKSRELSPRSANFWGEIYKVNKKEILCLRKSFQKKQKIHWPY